VRGLSTGLPTADGDNGAGVDVAGVEPVFFRPAGLHKAHAPEDAARAAGIKCCACAAFDMNYAPARAAASSLQMKAVIGPGTAAAPHR